MPPMINGYQDDIDFAALAIQDAEFAKVLKSNGQLDFSNPESIQQLTKSLLRRDFGLRIDLPDDRLCPPVPNRLNYILWIQKLLDTTSESYSEKYDPEREVVGIDIGTGASCIYPLLGCSQRPNWRFVGTDIDEKSLKFARQNVTANGLQDRIKIIQTQAAGEILPKNDLEIDFTMCNPPFYSSQDELLSLAASKQRPPFSACTGSANEMVTPGGETAFVSRMITESLVLRDRIQWFSSMLGKFSSIGPVVEELKRHGVVNWAVTEFVQGSKTRRWAVAWSFQDLRPPLSISRGVGDLPKALLPFPANYPITLLGTEPFTVGERIDETLSQLPLKWMWKTGIKTGLGFSEKAVWSRASRRSMSHTKPKQTNDEETEDESDVFGFKISVEPSIDQAGTKVSVRWVKGQDSVIFESFCGMLKRKLSETI